MSLSRELYKMLRIYFHREVEAVFRERCRLENKTDNFNRLSGTGFTLSLEMKGNLVRLYLKDNIGT